MARTTDERLDYLMEQLEKGTQNIFESGRYAEYLAVMSKFHHYSFRNTILIFLQNPNASHAQDKAVCFPCRRVRRRPVSVKAGKCLRIFREPTSLRTGRTLTPTFRRRIR